MLYSLYHSQFTDQISANENQSSHFSTSWYGTKLKPALGIARHEWRWFMRSSISSFINSITSQIAHVCKNSSTYERLNIGFRKSDWFFGVEFSSKTAAKLSEKVRSHELFFFDLNVLAIHNLLNTCSLNTLLCWIVRWGGSCYNFGENLSPKALNYHKRID